MMHADVLDVDKYAFPYGFLAGAALWPAGY